VEEDNTINLQLVMFHDLLPSHTITLQETAISVLVVVLLFQKEQLLKLSIRNGILNTFAAVLVQEHCLISSMHWKANLCVTLVTLVDSNVPNVARRFQTITFLQEEMSFILNVWLQNVQNVKIQFLELHFLSELWVVLGTVLASTVQTAEKHFQRLSLKRTTNLIVLIVEMLELPVLLYRMSPVQLILEAVQHARIQCLERRSLF